jgi:mono/diheme cytochrome c family protein
MRITGNQTRFLGGVAMAIAVSGCNSFDDAPSEADTQPRLVIPVDERPASTASVRPTAISGGTLLVAADSTAAVVSDPERDTISVVDLSTLAIRQTIQLEAGDEPGRAVEDSDHFAHVVLRGSGTIAVVNTLTGNLVTRHAVCKAPRGIAFQPSSKQLHVACTEGKLVTLDAATGAVARTLSLDNDLRDVLVRGDELWVTRFKSAELLRVKADGTVAGRNTIPRRAGVLAQPPEQSDPNQFQETPTKSVTIDAGVAWRATAAPAGGAVLVHQEEVADEIDLPGPSTQGSAYGGGAFDCSGIVKNAISVMQPDGSVTTTTIQGAPLPVDVAVSSDWIAVAHAGPADFSAPRPFFEFPNTGGGDVATSGGVASGFGGGGTVSLISQNTLLNGSDCAFSEMFVPVQEPVTAVAFAGDGRLLAQTREPAQLYVVDVYSGTTNGVISLSTQSRLDTGHELFHRDAGGGIACASCHPEGGEDGKTWHFKGTDGRRTQALHVGLEGTAPFHWAGDLDNVGELMSEVFVARMGGVRQSAPRLETLNDWLFSIKAPPAMRAADDAAAQRGRELFDSVEVGCASCHSGAKLTNNQSVAIDSIAKNKFQVPSLVAIAYRAPFMHTGCAATLAGRFDPACGGDLHGNTAGLSQPQVDDLVAYLESL